MELCTQPTSLTWLLKYHRIRSKQKSKAYSELKETPKRLKRTEYIQTEMSNYSREMKYRTYISIPCQTSEMRTWTNILTGVAFPIESRHLKFAESCLMKLNVFIELGTPITT